MMSFSVKPNIIRAVFSDVDGTLLNAERELSPRTIRAIRQIPADIAVVLASSRMPSAMTHLQAELGITGAPLICYNGGYVLAQGHREVLADHVIPADICTSIVGQAASSPVHISLYHADAWFAAARDKWTDKEERITKVHARIRPLTDVVTEWRGHHSGAHKIMCMGEPSDIARFYNWLNAIYGTQIHIYRSRPTYLELAAREISKATAMDVIMRRVLQATSAEAMAFGDNYNDTEMLRLAGLGIAVGNAVEEARLAAREITASGVDDGVAEFLERYFGSTGNQHA